MTTTNPQAKPIHAVMGFNQLSEGDFSSRASAVEKGTYGNPAFTTPAPPIDQPTFSAAVDLFNSLKAEGLDGSKKTLTAKNKQRHVVTTMLRQLATYVEALSNGDLAIFTSSGFVAASTTKTPPQPTAPTTIDKVDQGKSGELKLGIKGRRGARSYNLRYAAMANGVPATWITVILTNVKGLVTVANLTPGTTYAFQVQVLGALGLTDWSDSVTRMCI